MNSLIQLYAFTYGTHFLVVLAYSKEEALYNVSLLLKNTPGLEELSATDYNGFMFGDFAYHRCGA